MHKTESLPRGSSVASPGSRLRDIEEQLPGIDDLKEKLQDANHRALRFMKERPEVCLVGALALGFVIGRIVRARG
jgi:hypothetical protein